MDPVGMGGEKVVDGIKRFQHLRALFTFLSVVLECIMELRETKFPFSQIRSVFPSQIPVEQLHSVHDQKIYIYIRRQ